MLMFVRLLGQFVKELWELLVRIILEIIGSHYTATNSLKLSLK